MATIQSITVKETTIRTITQNGIDYICLTDIARQKNPIEPKDVVKNWMRSKNTIEYLGMWELLNNPLFKGVEFDPLLQVNIPPCGEILHKTMQMWRNTLQPNGSNSTPFYKKRVVTHSR